MDLIKVNKQISVNEFTITNKSPKSSSHKIQTEIGLRLVSSSTVHSLNMAFSWGFRTVTRSLR